ncbi:hypothetical protein ACHAXN_006177 [Cyclotella atomus]
MANNYGSVGVPQGNNDHYDENNTRYLNQTPFLWGRFFRAAIPILIALVIMGGFGYGMSHGFNHLYGPSGRDDDSHSTSIKMDTTLVPKSKTTISDSTSKGDSRQCSMHEKCQGLGGNCCPSDEGITLECCN